MVVDQKIEEAEYFLDKIKNAKRREDFIPNLSAFLASSRSIADYLLEDYNLTFGLQISLNDKLYPSTFEKIAKKKNNQIALKFIAYYNTEFRKLEVDAIGGLLLNKRNIKVHRTDVPLLADFSAHIVETVNVHDSVAIEVRDKYGNLKINSSTTDQDPRFGLKKSGDSSISDGTSDQDQNVEDKGSNNNAGSITVEWYFDNYKTADVIDVCEKFLNLTKDFVQKIKNNFP